MTSTNHQAGYRSEDQGANEDCVGGVLEYVDEQAS